MRAGLALLPLCVALGCARAPEPPPAPAKLDTVEVGAARDATLSTAGDTQEKRRESGFSGVLPGGFPKDVPVYVPSTLVDFGGAPGGAFCLFQTPDAPATVRARLGASLKAKGWTAAGGDAYSKGGRTVRIALADARPGTRLRVEY